MRVAKSISRHGHRGAPGRDLLRVLCKNRHNNAPMGLKGCLNTNFDEPQPFLCANSSNINPITLYSFAGSFQSASSHA